MGFIPIFLTLAGACLLFFMTVRNTFLQKIKTEKEIVEKILSYLPASKLKNNSLSKTDWIFESLDSLQLEKDEKEDLLKNLQYLKINRIAYNKLLKKAPYNWVAKLGGFQEI